MKPNTIKTTRYLLAAVVVAAVLVIVWIGFSTDDSRTESTHEQEEFEVSASEPEYSEVEVVERNQVVNISGRIRADNRLELHPEVSGQVVTTDKPLREGIHFEEGEPLLQIDSEELELQLKASRSSFQSLLNSILPDIKLDFPDQLDRMEQWIQSIHPGEPLPELPEIDNSSLYSFLSSREVFNTYYDIRSREKQLDKHIIRAPFPGIVSSSKVEPGQNVGPGQHVATFVDTSRFILTSSVRSSVADLLRTGDRITVSGDDGRREWEATLTRINPSLDERAQRVEVYFKISGPSLREGMYLEGAYETGPTISVSRIPKSALHRAGHVNVIGEDMIELKPVRITDIEQEYVWVEGLQEGQKVVLDATHTLSGRIIPSNRER